MIVYNITFSVDQKVAAEWLSWMKTKHIPGLSGLIVECKILKVLTHDDDLTDSFAVQYYSNSLKDVEEFVRQEALHPFGDKVVGFPTLLEEV